MSQWGLPTSDISKGTEPPSQCGAAGDSDGNAYNELDEGFGAGRGSGSGPDSATSFWWHGATATEVSGHIECGLSSVTDPVSSTGHIARFQYSKGGGSCSTSPGGGGQQNDATLVLKQGATTRRTETFVDAGSAAGWTSYTSTLSGAEADAITNYADLRLRIWYVKVGGGAGRSGQTSALEFECPNAPSGIPNEAFIIGNAVKRAAHY